MRDPSNYPKITASFEKKKKPRCVCINHLTIQNTPKKVLLESCDHYDVKDWSEALVVLKTDEVVGKSPYSTMTPFRFLFMLFNPLQKTILKRPWETFTDFSTPWTANKFSNWMVCNWHQPPLRHDARGICKEDDD